MRILLLLLALIALPGCHITFGPQPGSTRPPYYPPTERPYYPPEPRYDDYYRPAPVRPTPLYQY